MHQDTDIRQSMSQRTIHESLTAAIARADEREQVRIREMFNLKNWWLII